MTTRTRSKRSGKSPFGLMATGYEGVLKMIATHMLLVHERDIRKADAALRALKGYTPDAYHAEAVEDARLYLLDAAARLEQEARGGEAQSKPQ